MKKIIILLSVIAFTSCLNVTVDTKGAVSETSTLIKEGVKGGIDLYKSMKDTTKIDTIKNKKQK